MRLRPESVRAWKALHRTWQAGIAIARACLGVPDYDAYLGHRATHHPGDSPLTRAQFCAQRESARYARGSTRCC